LYIQIISLVRADINDIGFGRCDPDIVLVCLVWFIVKCPTFLPGLHGKERFCDPGVLGVRQKNN